jgi:hypothetical protein
VTAVFWLLLVAGLTVASWDFKAIAGAPGDPLNYVRLASAVLLIAYPVTMLKRLALRLGTLVASGASLTGAAVSLWDAARAPADWAYYFSAALLVLLTLAMWIVSRCADARRV